MSPLVRLYLNVGNCSRTLNAWQLEQTLLLSSEPFLDH